MRVCTQPCGAFCRVVQQSIPAHAGPLLHGCLGAAPLSLVPNSGLRGPSSELHFNCAGAECTGRTIQVAALRSSSRTNFARVRGRRLTVVKLTAKFKRMRTRHCCCTALLGCTAPPAETYGSNRRGMSRAMFGTE